MFVLSNKSLGNLVGVHPILSYAVLEAIKISKQDFVVFEGVRTTKRQQELLAKGFSKTKDSYHQYGLAVDLVPLVNGAPSWEKENFKEVLVAMKTIIKKLYLPIQNGMDLWGWDEPHWQISGLKSQYDIRKIRPDLFKG